MCKKVKKRIIILHAFATNLVIMHMDRLIRILLCWALNYYIYNSIVKFTWSNYVGRSYAYQIIKKSHLLKHTIKHWNYEEKKINRCILLGKFTSRIRSKEYNDWSYKWSTMDAGKGYSGSDSTVNIWTGNLLGSTGSSELD